jgi:hypothetical protein
MGLIDDRPEKGTPLPATVRDIMGTRFGADFSAVRVHTSPSNAVILGQRDSFTRGSDIFFRYDAYQPHTPKGQSLLAHELAHVIQTGGTEYARPDTYVFPPGESPVDAASVGATSLADAVVASAPSAYLAQSADGSEPSLAPSGGGAQPYLAQSTDSD